MLLGRLIPSLNAPRRTAAAQCLALVLLAAGTGCVRVYQPMSGLHRPAVVDPQAANFNDVHLTVHCVPGDLLEPQHASTLCDRVSTLFENQGAQVRTLITARGLAEDVREENPTEAEGDEAPEPPSTDLVLELRARKLHKSHNAVSWALCILTFTLLPGQSESTFAQEVTIRDGDGFLLVSDSLQGRIVSRFGAGTWVGNKLMDLVWRDHEDKLTGPVMAEDLSADLYLQLSQLLFNAKMQWQVLRQAPPSTRVQQEVAPWR